MRQTSWLFTKRDRLFELGTTEKQIPPVALWGLQLVCYVVASLLTMTDDHLGRSGWRKLDCHLTELTRAWERFDGRVLNHSEEKETGF